jgi:transcriptional regulator with XRE-family HTH domain
MEPTIGERLSRWLMFKRIKAADLARALSVSRTTTHKWINNQVSPDGDRLESIAKVLGISMVDFFGPLPDLHSVAEARDLAPEESELGPHPTTGDITRELDVVAMERQREHLACPTCGRTGEAA